MVFRGQQPHSRKALETCNATEDSGFVTRRPTASQPKGIGDDSIREQVARPLHLRPTASQPKGIGDTGGPVISSREITARGQQPRSRKGLETVPPPVFRGEQVAQAKEIAIRDRRRSRSRFRGHCRGARLHHRVRTATSWAVPLRSRPHRGIRRRRGTLRSTWTATPSAAKPMCSCSSRPCGQARRTDNRNAPAVRADLASWVNG